MNKSKRNSILNTQYSILNTVLEPGITYVEVLTGLAVMAVLGIMIASVYLAHFRLFSVQSTNIDIANQNTLAIDEMANQIREGEAIAYYCVAVSCIPGGTGITPYRYSDDNEILVYLWPLDASGNPVDWHPGPNYTQPDFIYYRLVDQGNGTYNLVKDTARYDSSPMVSTRKEYSKIIASGIKYNPTGPSEHLFRYYDASGNEILVPTPAPPSIPALATATKIVITLKTTGKALNDKQPAVYTQTRSIVLRNK